MPTAVDVNALYDASYRRLVVQLYAICGDLPTPEDAVQDAFVTAMRKRSQLARVNNPEAWVRAVAINRVRTGWRHASVVRRYQARLPGPQVSGGGRPRARGDRDCLAGGRNRPAGGSRPAPPGRYAARPTSPSELGVPEGTVKSRLSRARGRLARLLDDNPNEREGLRHA